MNVICFRAICFIVEFLKLFLAVGVLCRIRQSKKIYVFFAAELFVFMFLSCFCGKREMSFLTAIFLLLLFIVNAYEKKKAGFIVLTYVGISIVDMIFSSVCIVVFHITMEQINQNPWIDIGLNSCSLVIILFMTLVLAKKRKQFDRVKIKKYLPIYVLGGLALSIYLTSVQFMGLEKEISTYRHGLVLGLSLSSIILIIVCVLLVINSNENDHLKREAELNLSLLEAQKEYYTMLLLKENETRAFRHDIRKHMYCMSNLFHTGKYEELGKYLGGMSEKVEELSPKIQTGNGLITAMVNDILRRFPEVHVEWTGMIPEELRIASLDICTIFYNLLMNAAEAAHETREGNVEVVIQFMLSAMVVTIRNRADGEPKMMNGEFVSGKPGDGHGYGLRNVKKCIDKNNGEYSASYSQGVFVTEVVLPNAIYQA